MGGTSNRGVVAACSYEARKYHVRSAMPIAEAKRRCPQGIYIKPNIAKYALVSSQIVAIFQRFSPLVETLALDEAFLDVTGMEMMYPDVTEIARQIKTQVKTELDLVVSVGVAPNKFLAKLASAWQKPDGLFVIKPGEEIDLLASLPVTKLWGVGEATEQILRSLTITTVADIRAATMEKLEQHLGKHAFELYNLAWGRDERPVVPDGIAKSIGNENTFEQDITARDRINAELLSLAENVGWRLRKEGLSGRTVTLKVRFSSFQTITRSTTIADPVAIDEVIYNTAVTMINKIEIKEGIRLLGITVSNLGRRGVQLSLFDEEAQRQEKIAVVMDTLKERFGKDIIKRAGTIEWSRRE